MYHKSIGSPQRYLSKKLHRRRSEFWPTYRRWIIGAISSLLMVLIIYIIMTSIVYAPRYQIVDLQITHGDSSTSEQSTIDQYIYQIIGNDTSYLSLR
ncbi:MAG: hypothetical protein H6766_03475 [Candidatus Peribacteria bacterium]|nr:MAG: hypothetical protein H6766_03475 [Candidatus Peribacteria bacterium]